MPILKILATKSRMFIDFTNVFVCWVSKFSFIKKSENLEYICFRNLSNLLWMTGDAKSQYIQEDMVGHSVRYSAHFDLWSSLLQ